MADLAVEISWFARASRVITEDSEEPITTGVGRAR